MICSQPKVGIDSSEAIMPVVGELEVGEALLGRDLRAGLDGDDVEEAKHGRAAVLDLHDLVARHVAGLDEAERVVDAERGGHQCHPPRTSGPGGGGADNGRREGVDLLEERKGDNGLGHHDYFCGGETTSTSDGQPMR